MTGQQKDIGLIVFVALVALAWCALMAGGAISIVQAGMPVGETIGALSVAGLFWLGFSGLALWGVHDGLKARAELVEKEEW